MLFLFKLNVATELFSTAFWFAQECDRCGRHGCTQPRAARVHGASEALLAETAGSRMSQPALTQVLLSPGRHPRAGQVVSCHTHTHLRHPSGTNLAETNLCKSITIILIRSSLF